MNHEHIKKLKDAGFNFKRVGCHECDEGRERFDVEHETLYAPTLSELINECGEGITLRSNGSLWEAWNYSKLDKIISGLTPDDVLIDFWLTLNKKS